MSRFTKAPLRAYRTEKGGPNVYRCPRCRGENTRQNAKRGKVKVFLPCRECGTPLHLRGRFRGNP